MRQKVRAFSLCILAYLLALCAAVAIGHAAGDLHPVLLVLCADIGATLVIYLFSRLFANASFYDPYWSLAPLVIAFYWVIGFPSSGAVTLRQIFVITLVFIWGARLTFNWARQWRGLDHEDWRYRGLREKTGKWFWLVDLTGIELMPTFIVFLGCLALYPALVTGRGPFGLLDIVAVLVTAGAILLETVADEQLKNFNRQKSGTGAIIARGVWQYCRHPNYLGEVLFWWGIYLFALAASPVYWWTIIGPVMVTALFTFISVPLMDRRNLARRPGYDEVRKRIPALVPRLRLVKKGLLNSR